jgi:hypothetical protein
MWWEGWEPSLRLYSAGSGIYCDFSVVSLHETWIEYSHFLIRHFFNPLLFTHTLAGDLKTWTSRLKRRFAFIHSLSHPRMYNCLLKVLMMFCPVVTLCSADKKSILAFVLSSWSRLHMFAILFSFDVLYESLLFEAFLFIPANRILCSKDKTSTRKASPF